MPTVLERMLQQAAVDPDFRSESAEFGVDMLPESVQEQEERFSELLDVGMQAVDVVAQCRSTCSFGPFTIVCDGTTK